MPKIWEYLQYAMDAIDIESHHTRQYYDVGEGGVILFMSGILNAIVVWDGREHVDINLFTEGEFTGLPEKFIGAFLYVSGRAMKVGLRDDQPRGIGHVINFPSDIESDEDEAEE
jgi:hypothetical protein